MTSSDSTVSPDSTGPVPSPRKYSTFKHVVSVSASPHQGSFNVGTAKDPVVVYWPSLMLSAKPGEPKLTPAEQNKYTQIFNTVTTAVITTPVYMPNSENVFQRVEGVTDVKNVWVPPTEEVRKAFVDYIYRDGNGGYYEPDETLVQISGSSFTAEALRTYFGVDANGHVDEVRFAEAIGLRHASFLVGWSNRDEYVKFNGGTMEWTMRLAHVTRPREF